MPLKLKEPRKGYSKFWTVRGTHLGRSVNRSTKATDRKTAKQVLDKIKAEIERDVLAEPKEPLGLTFAQAAYRYAREGKDGELRFIKRLLAYFGETPISQIGQKEIEDAAFALYPDAKNATRNRSVFTPMSAILHHAGIEKNYRRPEGADGEARQFSLKPEEAEALISVAHMKDRELECFLVLLLYTGLRLNEAIRLEINNLDLSNATAFVAKTKNGEPRTVHLPPIVTAALANHPRGLDREGRVFRFHAGGKFNKVLKRVADAAGVRFPEGVAFHGFRHTWGSWMRRYAGLDTTGLVATGAWTSHEAARRYEHAITSEEAQRADLLPVIRAKPVQSKG